MISLIKQFLLSLYGIIELNILTRRVKKQTLVILSGIGIGDRCIQATYLNCWQENTHINYRIVCSPTYTNVLKNMGFDDLIIISKLKIEAIIFSYMREPARYFSQKMINKGRIIIVEPILYLRGGLSGIEGVSALNTIRDAVFKLFRYQNIYQTYPQVSGQVSDVIHKYSIPDKFIIINPYSNSCHLDNTYIEMLANELTSLGYTIFTNVYGSQKVIPGTSALQCTIDELYLLSSCASCIISVRSGILDYIFRNCKKMFVLYDSIEFQRFFTLLNWNNTQSSIEEFVLLNNNDLSNSVNCIKNYLSINGN